MANDRFILLAFLAAAAIGCDDPKGSTPSGAASASAASASAVVTPPAPPVRFTVQPFGAAVFVMKAAPGSAGKDIKGIAKTFSGELQIVPSDLTRTSGSMAVDLTSLETHGLGDDALDGEITTQVLDWFEVGKTSLKEPLRFARVTIRSIDEASEKNAFDLPADKRRVTLKATGDLELHGVKQEKKLELTLTFATASGAVSAVTVRTAQPITVSLSTYSVKPSGAGSPADEASITFELSAKVGP